MEYVFSFTYASLITRLLRPQSPYRVEHLLTTGRAVIDVVESTYLVLRIYRGARRISSLGVIKRQNNLGERGGLSKALRVIVKDVEPYLVPRNNNWGRLDFQVVAAFLWGEVVYSVQVGTVKRLWRGIYGWGITLVSVEPKELKAWISPELKF
ncbi:hypothetical protein Tco_1066690 [Tanacetum coccineum]|uniref:Uncharacterized protein n=1 Tax=Tanacetum coccineum TaxID=301880 RepID=A0ABQ5HB53_9ASTR